MISMLLESVSGPLAAFVALIVSAFVAWFGGRVSGKRAVKAKLDKKKAEDLEATIRVRNANAAKTDAAVSGDINRWMRPD